MCRMIVHVSLLVNMKCRLQKKSCIIVSTNVTVWRATVPSSAMRSSRQLPGMQKAGRPPNANSATALRFHQTRTFIVPDHSSGA